MNIVLIGMSGSGKSTFGAFLSQLMNMPIIDLDGEICAKYGDISTIFEKGGEKLFRELEAYEVKNASMTDNCIIATGGGVVVNKDNMKALKKNGLIVYLYCDVDFLFDRLKDKNDRPLLNAQGDEDKKQKIEQIFLSRSNDYLQYADIVLNESGILESRNLLNSELEKQLGALYIEFLNAFEKKVYKRFD